MQSPDKKKATVLKIGPGYERIYSLTYKEFLLSESTLMVRDKSTCPNKEVLYYRVTDGMEIAKINYGVAWEPIPKFPGYTYIICRQKKEGKFTGCYRIVKKEKVKNPVTKFDVNREDWMYFKKEVKKS